MEMTKEEKELLIKDLCGRLLYGVKVKVFDNDILRYDTEYGVLYGKENMDNDDFVIKCHNDSWVISCEDFKPYLRPMSSITDEEKEELKNISAKYIDDWENAKTAEEKWELGAKTSYINAEFYYSHYLDWNGLIEKGLAIAVTENNNPYK
jgi:hypothetical protein